MNLVINNRKGVMVDVVVKLMIAGAVLILLGLLLLRMFEPSYDESRYVTESYFENFEDAVERADEGKLGEFITWSKPGDNEVYFLVNFGNNHLIKDWVYSDFEEVYYSHSIASTRGGETVSVNFYRSDTENSVCICSINLNEKKNSNSFEDDPLGAHHSSSKLYAICDNCIDLEHEARFVSGTTKKGYVEKGRVDYKSPVDFEETILNSNLESDPVIRLEYTKFGVYIKRMKSGDETYYLFDEKKIVY
jgi:hypothetical protein